MKNGLTVGYTVCMAGDLVVNAHLDNCVDVLLDNGGEHEKHGKVIEEVPIDTQPEEGCRLIGNIYGGKPVPKKQEAQDMGMVDADGAPAERKAEKKTAKKKSARRR
ncbi:MAG: hypothetical protein GTO62_16410 [Planctomycetales bacterium]|nr:hypothetical protein [Planctomycetales bacterium]NIP70816.1 hypothetical protein [Planctomycetales bacterium]